jgi:hypothetical protein
MRPSAPQAVHPCAAVSAVDYLNVGPRDKIAGSDFERAQRARRARRRDAPGKVGHCQAFYSKPPVNSRGLFILCGEPRLLLCGAASLRSRSGVREPRAHPLGGAKVHRTIATIPPLPLSVCPRDRIAGSNSGEAEGRPEPRRRALGFESGAGIAKRSNRRTKPGRCQAFIPDPTTTCRRVFYRHLSAMACGPWNIS